MTHLLRKWNYEEDHGTNTKYIILDCEVDDEDDIILFTESLKQIKQVRKTHIRLNIIMKLSISINNNRLLITTEKK